MRLSIKNGFAKPVFVALSSLGAIGIMLAFTLFVALFVITIASTLMGLYLAFSASVLLGLIVLFVEPLPFVLGILYFLTGNDFAVRIVEAFKHLS